MTSPIIQTVEGRWTFPIGNAGTATAGVANRAEFLPILLGPDFWADAVGIRVAMAGTNPSASALVGIYTDARGVPGEALIRTTFDNLTDTVGYQVELGEPVLLPPVVWSCVVLAEAAVTPRLAGIVGSGTAGSFGPALGVTSAGALPTSNAGHATGLQRGWAFTSGLPDSFAAGSFAWFINTAVPMVGLRRAAARRPNRPIPAARSSVLTPGTPALPSSLQADASPGAALPAALPTSIG